MSGTTLRKLLEPGDPFPWIAPRSPGRDAFAVGSMAGRFLVFGFFGRLTTAAAQRALAALDAHRALFDDKNRSFFAISVDRQDEAEGRAVHSTHGLRQLWDFDGAASRLCGVVQSNAAGGMNYLQSWIVVDPTLHVLAVFPFNDEDADHAAVFAYLRSLPDADNFAGFEIPAPVLVLPNVLEQDLCRELIGLYDRHGGSESGVVRKDGNVLDAGFKRRKDYTIDDPGLIGRLQQRITARVVPEIRKLFFMEITRMERYIVGCYAAEDGGHFGPHRDNGPGLTEHRRFAVSINLNADFEGGAVRFPEYNRRSIKAPPGWAVVFPCAILHAVSKVTAGRRYAFLPFVYDEEGAKIRERNLRTHHARENAASNPAQAAEAAV